MFGGGRGLRLNLAGHLALSDVYRKLTSIQLRAFLGIRWFIDAGQNQNKHTRNNISLHFFSFKVKHFLLNGRVCLGIFSSCPLPKGAEITIPFEFQFEEYHSYMDCACRQEMCAVMKYNSKNQNQNHDAHAQKRLKPYEEDSNSNSQQKMSPLRVSLPNSQGLQVRNDSWRRLSFISFPRKIRSQRSEWRE